MNASLHDRASAIFEGIAAAIRLSRGRSAALVPETLYPGDLEVLKNLAEGTEVELIFVPVDAQSGCINLTKIKAQAAEAADRLAAIRFSASQYFWAIGGGR